MVKKTLSGSVSITVMLVMIIAGARAFSNNLSYTGATQGLVEFVVGLDMSPLLLLVGMQVIVLFMGMFMELTSITMITLPLYMPIIAELGFDPVWFGVVFLLNLTIGVISPPFGLELFVMKGVAPTDTTMGDIYKAVIPFCILDLIVMSLLIAFPQIVLWLPNLIRGA